MRACRRGADERTTGTTWAGAGIAGPREAARRSRLCPVGPAGQACTSGLQVWLAGQACRSGLRSGELLLELRDALFQFLETHAGAGEHLRLRVEFLAGDEIELREALRQHGLHVALDILGRRVFQQIADARLQVVENVAGLLHVIPLHCTKNVHLQLHTCP